MIRRQRSVGLWSKTSLWQIVLKTLFQKCSTQNRAGGMAQVVEYLPSKHVILSSNPTTIKKKEMDP
jgi:hypothetical protein